MWLLVETAITKTKQKNTKMSNHAGHIGLSAHSSRKSFVMGEKASYFLGMKNTEQSTSRHCCISLIRRKQESNLTVNQRCPPKRMQLVLLRRYTHCSCAVYISRFNFGRELKPRTGLQSRGVLVNFRKTNVESQM